MSQNQNASKFLAVTLIALSLIQSTSADAMILLDVAISPFFSGEAMTDRDVKEEYFGKTKVLCWMLLPLCLLDGQTHPGSLNKNDLISSGLSDRAATSFIKEAEQLTSRLSEKKMALKVGRMDTSTSIAHEILEVMPTASKDFVRFYSTLVVSRQ